MKRDKTCCSWTTAWAWKWFAKKLHERQAMAAYGDDFEVAFESIEVEDFEDR